MNIGEIIKKLRREKDMTQEQLAEYLNITTQAVSKWETNLSMPDITLLPMIANIFDVSADILLGIDVEAKEKRIQEILNRAEEYRHNGCNMDKARETLRAGLKEYPNSYKIMSDIMRFLYFQIYDEDRYGEAQDVLTSEIIKTRRKNSCRMYRR